MNPESNRYPFKDWHTWGISNAADEVRSLTSGIPGDRGRLSNFMVLQAYIDDSADGERSKVFTLAGYLANAEAWTGFAKEWEGHLKYCGLESFKLSEMTNSKPEIIGPFYRIIERHDIPLSIDCVLDIPMWRKIVDEIHWPNEARNLKKLIDNPYFLVSKKIMHSLFFCADELGLKEPIELIFDEQVGEKAILVSGWDYFKDTMTDKEKSLMGSVPSFKNDKKVNPLQAADLIAGYVRRSAVNGIPPENCNIFPWKANKDIKRLAIRFTEGHLRKELAWICSEENMLQAKSFFYPD